MPAQPQDRKPAKTEDFRFSDSEGESHTLPPVTAGKSLLKGRDLRDAAIGGEAGMLGYMFKLLEAAKPPAAALDALYDMSQEDMIEVIQAWSSHGDGDGEPLGK